MFSETYQNKNITTVAGDSISKPNDMTVEKSNTTQHSFFIVVGSLLALLVLVLIAVTGRSGGQHLELSAYEIDASSSAGSSAGADYVAPTATSALTMDFFGENKEESCKCACPFYITNGCSFWSLYVIRLFTRLYLFV